MAGRWSWQQIFNRDQRGEQRQRAGNKPPRIAFKPDFDFGRNDVFIGRGHNPIRPFTRRWLPLLALDTGDGLPGGSMLSLPLATRVKNSSALVFMSSRDLVC